MEKLELKFEGLKVLSYREILRMMVPCKENIVYMSMSSMVLVFFIRESRTEELKWRKAKEV